MDESRDASNANGSDPGSESGFIFEESDVEAPGDQPSSPNPLPQCDVKTVSAACL